MKKNDNIIWGIVFIIVGIIFGLKALGIFDFNIFFEGWWTLFIIIPCFIGIIKQESKTGSIIGLIIGIMLLLDVRDVIDTDLFWKLIIPMIFVVIGISMIFKNSISEGIRKEISELDTNENKNYLTATFGEQSMSYDKEVFTGSVINAIFGGVKLNLRNCKIKEDVVINTTSIFGGVDILVPDDINIKLISTNIFGGVDNKVKREVNPKFKTIYINATNIFGGTDIK